MSTAHKFSEPHIFSPVILREYDIRGIVGDDLTEADAYTIGRCFGTKITRDNGKHVCVGYDGRQSSPILQMPLLKDL